ncbi:MAG: hypothetical protein HGB19_00740 [Chlorobiales bacterium]|nr:hypothetical protein [Chlorobiales bacterium]
MADNQKNLGADVGGAISNVLQSLGNLLEKDIIPTISKFADEFIKTISSIVEKIFGTVQSTTKALNPPSQQGKN